jgi:glucose dehydrogenase
MRRGFGIIGTTAMGAWFAAFALLAEAIEYKKTVNGDSPINSTNEPQDWLMMNGDYGATRYSKLTQTDRDNVKNLRWCGRWRCAACTMSARTARRTKSIR